ncbi:hypothetical protein evm_005308 [Chilo suppressalis]|nr:hypothetical protein evm_005308 [Chilo suppressalis]
MTRRHNFLKSLACQSSSRIFIERVCPNYYDIKVKEPTEESLTKKVRQYMDPKFMSVKEAAAQLIEIINNKPNSGIDKSSIAVGLSRVGASDQRIIVRSLEEMQHFDLGPPLHSLVIPAHELHPLETDYLAQFR